MSLSHVFLLKKDRWKFVLVAVILLFSNFSVLIFSHYSVLKQQQLLITAIPLEYIEKKTAAVWINRTELSGIGFTDEALEAHSYKKQLAEQQLVFIDRTLLSPISWQFYVFLNLFLLAATSSLLLLQLQGKNKKTEEEQALREVVELLQQRVQLIDEKGQFDPLLQLRKIADQLVHLNKREQEIRHLVRVQGLIDHELAIGNRVFFESKLQHYLSEQSEFAEGGLYIIQITHPEPNISSARQVARLKECIEIINSITADYSDSVIARLSDNDLVLMISGLSDKETDKLGDRIVLLLSRANCFIECEDDDVVHVGYVSYQRGQTSYQVLSEADMALKTAQLQGSNSAYGYQGQQQRPPAKGSVWWRSELSRALQQQRFVLSFQPVYSWQDKDVLQHEVLVRLNSSDGEKIPAAIFLPMAYNCGLACQLDQHVLLKAAKLCAAEHRQSARCSVNISIQSLLQPEWWQWLEQMIAEGQIDAGKLALEITEHHLVRHYKQLKRKLTKLNLAGFALIVDHVGLVIDHSSYADELPLESVKLHPSVVRNIDQHLEQQLFVRGLIASYARKGIRVIAAGVEQEQEWLTLQKLGVAGGQGFYFSQPLAQLITQNQLQ